MTKRVPYGVSNYRKLVNGDYYHVDKTWAIREFEPICCPVFLRPRRFGKSVLTFMLESYYDVIYADDFESLFGGTDIGRNPTQSHNCYNVLRLDFSVVNPGNSIEELRRNFAGMLFWELNKVLMRRGIDLGTLKEEPNAEKMLVAAITLLNKKNGRPAYIIIDEYDNFTNQLIQANADSVYYEATGKDSFLKTFFKTLKEGIGDESIANCFLTGVLPVTMDDLTSGFNIATDMTLHPRLNDALGFTEEEIKSYTAEIFRDMKTPADIQARVLLDLKDYYDGYLMTPTAGHHLYNSTICNFYLQDFILNNGDIPSTIKDSNVQMDLGWIERLAGNGQAARQFIEKLVLEGRTPFSADALGQRFNLNRFLTSEYLPVSLFFLGQLTWCNQEELGFPNLTTRMLFIEKFNDLNKYADGENQALVTAFRQYRQDDDLEKLFHAYWNIYIGLFPAVSFKNVGEHFFQMTFYYFCYRFMLRGSYPKIEENLSSGCADLTYQGTAGTAQAGKAYVLEFKHRSASQSLPDVPPAKDINQVKAYAAGKRQMLGDFSINTYLLYTSANHGYRIFRV